MTKKIWQVHFVAGNPKIMKKVRTSEPKKREKALSAAKKLANYGWRVWVQHLNEPSRIYESPAEINFNTI